jgi:hypothetical protein
VRLVLGYRSLTSFAGSETYLLTIAEHLQRLGHEVTVYTAEKGEIAGVAEERGTRIVDSQSALPEDCEGVLVQDGATAYELADRYRSAPRLFVAHSTEFVTQLPPQLPGVSAAVVVMNDRVGRYVQRVASRPEVVRLRQPVDLERFGRIAAASSASRRVLVFGNEHRSRYRTIAGACEELGLSADLVGQHGRPSARPEQELAEADIVIGIGRCVVEAMASRKAAYVYGVVGGDGWVTPETYALLEADGFSGRATDALVDLARMRTDLAQWNVEMGIRNRDLAFLNHDATAHAAELVALWERLGAEAGPPAAHTDELARLVRLQSQLENRAAVFARESRRVRTRAEELAAQLEAVKSTRRYRAAGALATPLELVRRLLGSVRRLRSSRRAGGRGGEGGGLRSEHD